MGTNNQPYLPGGCVSYVNDGHTRLIVHTGVAASQHPMYAALCIKTCASPSPPSPPEPSPPPPSPPPPSPPPPSPSPPPPSAGRCELDDISAGRCFHPCDDGTHSCDVRDRDDLDEEDNTTDREGCGECKPKPKKKVGSGGMGRVQIERVGCVPKNYKVKNVSSVCLHRRPHTRAHAKTLPSV